MNYHFQSLFHCIPFNLDITLDVKFENWKNLDLIGEIFYIHLKANSSGIWKWHGKVPYMMESAKSKKTKGIFS